MTNQHLENFKRKLQSMAEDRSIGDDVGAALMLARKNAGDLQCMAETVRELMLAIEYMRVACEHVEPDKDEDQSRIMNAMKVGIRMNAKHSGLVPDYQQASFWDDVRQVPTFVSLDNALFDMESVLLDSPRLRLIKEHDIQTHHAPHMEEAPWLAVPVRLAKQFIDAVPGDPDCVTLVEIMANYCRVIDEAGLVFYGMTQSEAEDAAVAYLLANVELICGEDEL